MTSSAIERRTDTQSNRRRAIAARRRSLCSIASDIDERRQFPLEGGFLLTEGRPVNVEVLVSDRKCNYSRWLAILLILAITVFRAIYLFFFCPYDLAPDEAHYWDWSRHLDWSYYSKGPLVAWIIRAGCELFGAAALAADGTLMPAVRMSAVLCGSGLLFGLYVLTYQTFRSDRLALAVVLAGLSFPPFTACSLLMTIDAPFLCCWAWALVFGRWALVDGKSWAWPAAGIFVALGILAKYTMVLWLGSAGLFLFLSHSRRSLLFRPGFWIMTLVAALSAMPILYWNDRHDWVTFRHVAVQAGVAEGKTSGVRWLGPLEYLAGQFALLLGYWFVAWIGALIRFRPWGSTAIGIRYLWWMSVPTFAVFALSSIRANGQLNWPVAAYLSGAVLVAGWLPEVLNSSQPRFRKLTRWSFGIAIVVGALFSVLAHDTRLLTYLVVPRLPPETPIQPTPLRSFDPAARLKGYRFLADELDQIRERIRKTEGDEAVLAGLRWDIPGLLGFYCKGHPQAYSLGLVLRLDRHSQYDLWHPNPVDDAQAFLGRTFIVVGGGDPRIALASAFASIDPPQEVVYREHGQPLARWFVCVCRGFKGFDRTQLPGTDAGH
jgi:Dolichyl-phosphate-mannose-protein mannosyltransferase